MSAFLFLQKFDGGEATTMPYAPLMAHLSRIGVAGRGRGDMEIVMPADAMAATCTVVGNEQDGIVCVGFERPRFDEQLRALVWECMQAFGCAVFDDALTTVYAAPAAMAALPATLLHACRPGARRVSSAQQLWPSDFEIGLQGPARPALAYTNPNPHAANLQMFDYGSGRTLTIEIGIRPQVCNPGTLRVLRNLQLRVDAALAVNPEYAVVYRYSDPESALLVLESPTLGQHDAPATSASAPPGQVASGSGFVADRGIFASEDGQAGQFAEHVRDKYALAFEPGAAGIAQLAGLLDKAHAAYCSERDRIGAPGFSSTMASAWARMAGGYLGHFVVQQIGAQWGYITRAQQRLLVVRTHNGRICCPHHLVLDHIINGPGDSIVAPVAALMRAEASATARGEDLVCQVPVLCEQLRGARALAGGADLPFVQLLARDKLDFSVPSLVHLDHYLSQLATRMGQLSDQALTDAILCAGAYLGETIRSNTPDSGHWRWLGYEQAAGRDPAFAQARPREMSLLAILDSDTQMAYPFAHVAAILEGSASGNALAYAGQLGLGAGGPAAPAPAPPRPQSAAVRQAAPRPQPVPETAEQRAARHAEWSRQARQDEEFADRGAFWVNGTVMMLMMIVLAYTAKSGLDAFFTYAGSVGVGKQVLYCAWITGPSLFWAGYTVKKVRGFLPLAAMLAGCVLLTFFGTVTYGYHLVRNAGAENMPVFMWVPLVQFGWTVGWILVMQRYLYED